MLVVTLIWSSVVVFIGKRMITHSLTPKEFGKKIWGIWLGLNLIVLVQMLSRFSFGPDALHWFSLIFFGFVSILFFLLLISEILQFVYKITKKLFLKRGASRETDERKRHLFRSLVNSSILVSASGSTLLGVRTARRTPEVSHVEIPIENLHPDLVGFSIVQFSDLHVGPTIRRGFVDRAVKIINDLRPDLITFTGDIADGMPKDLSADVEPLRKLKARLGKFYITGNHEYYWDAPGWIEKAKELGFTALPNAHRILKHGRAKIMIAGVNDRKAGRILPDHASDPKAAIKGAPECDLSILLAHRPNSVYDAIDLGFDLQLSGHTHGGQFWPWNMFIGLAHAFSAGLGKYKNRMWVYVNRGTGYWGPPIRTGVPPEITKLTFVKA